MFKTSVRTQREVRSLKPLLDQLPQTQWNFDLQDCDKILRIDNAQGIPENAIIEILREKGFECEELQY